MTTDGHLAQINIGRLLHPADDPRVAGFMDNLERINAIAERSPGFVWRLKGASDATGATDLAWPDDPSMIANLSVWERAEDLEAFVWNTVHKRFYQQKTRWFETLAAPHFAMWRVPVGHTPSLREAADRLAHLRANGPSDHAFGWAELISAEGWRQNRCA